MAEKKIAVKFIKATLPYLVGETAWFNEIQAAAFIKQKFAVLDKDAGEYVPPKTRAEVLEEEDARQTAFAKKRERHAASVAA